MEADRLHSCVIGVVNNVALSLKKTPEKPPIPGALFHQKSLKL